MDKLTVRDLSDDQLRGRRALVRVDYNVPLDDEGRVEDDVRVRATLPTLQLLRERGASLVLMSHLGRPKGEPNPKYSLRPVGAHLAQVLGEDVDFAAETVSQETVAKSKSLRP
ncbi:MAG: phosphoglycerate kinase, partial [Gemmatimonadetes bacterium]|nr:phosphoglycerate kinase [Gemmatimonadota bacterium]NIO32234.1 phosphoglycerate kinase [Gemmatimonadota bacterium]